MKSSFKPPTPGGAPAAPAARTTPPPPPRRPGAAAPAAAAPAPRPPGPPKKIGTPPAAAPASRRPVAPPRAAAPPPPAEEEPAPEAEEQATEVETEVIPPEAEEPQSEEQAIQQATVPPRRRPGRPAGSTKALATRQSPQTQLSTEVRGNSMPRVGEVQGDFDPSDFQLPQLKISNAVGPLALLKPPIPPGRLVTGAVDQWAHLWEDGCAPLWMTVAWTQKGLVQTEDENGNNLYDNEERGMEFWGDGARQLMQQGGGSLARGNGLLLFAPAMRGQVLVQMPEGLEDEFGMFNVEIPNVEGRFLVAMWYLRSSSYTECAKKIVSEQGRFYEKDRIHTVNWLVEGKHIIGKRNAWYVPTLTNGTENTPELIEYLEQNG